VVVLAGLWEQPLQAAAATVAGGPLLEHSIEDLESPPELPPAWSVHGAPGAAPKHAPVAAFPTMALAPAFPGVRTASRSAAEHRPVERSSYSTLAAQSFTCCRVLLRLPGTAIPVSALEHADVGAAAVAAPPRQAARCLRARPTRQRPRRRRRRARRRRARRPRRLCAARWRARSRRRRRDGRARRSRSRRPHATPSPTTPQARRSEFCPSVCRGMGCEALCSHTWRGGFGGQQSPAAHVWCLDSKCWTLGRGGGGIETWSCTLGASKWG
jgi:hypothetical protein